MILVKPLPLLRGVVVRLRLTSRPLYSRYSFSEIEDMPTTFYCPDPTISKFLTTKNTNFVVVDPSRVVTNSVFSMASGELINYVLSLLLGQLLVFCDFSSPSCSSI
jgi:hypothetical protein